MIKGLNVKVDTVKHLAVTTGSVLLDTGLSNIFFLNLSQQARETKAKIDKWGYSKLKVICTAKEIIHQM